MKNLKSIAGFLVVAYVVTAMLIFAPYFNWTYARDNGFTRWLFLGEIVATAKAVAWPYFAFFYDTKPKETSTESINETPSSGVSSDQRIREYTDKVYNYAFQFPSDWKMKKPLETQVGEMRVLLEGRPGTAAFVIVLPNMGRTVTKAQYNDNPNRKAIVEAFMNFTLERIYKSQPKATRMVVSEKEIIPSEFGIQFYISTLQFIGPKELPMVLAGIHIIPFGKDHLINFVATTPLDPTAKQEGKTFDKVFSSFHLIDEHPIAEVPSRR